MIISRTPVHFIKKNLYEVQVLFQHGDNDGSNEATFTLKNINEQDLIAYIKAFYLVKDAIYHTNSTSQPMPFTVVSRFDDESYDNNYDQYIVNEDKKIFVSLMPDMFGGDEGYHAKMQIVDIRHFDENGKEFYISYDGE